MKISSNGNSVGRKKNKPVFFIFTDQVTQGGFRHDMLMLFQNLNHHFALTLCSC